MAFVVSVPNVPGVPSVFRDAATIGSSLQFLTSDAASIFTGSFLFSQWGIYLGGVPIILADTVVGFGYRQQWAVADFPIEEGGFESYDKVSTPFQSRFRFTAGGSQTNRTAFLESIAAIAGDTLLYNVVTPEQVYLNVTIDRYDYNRTAQSGVGLIAVDVSTTEIRIATPSAPGPTNTKEPSSSAQVNAGTVQGTAPSTAQTALVTGAGGFVVGGV